MTVDAEGPFGPVEQLEYEIDFNILKDSEARASGQLKDVTEQLKKTNKALDTISKNIRPPGHRG